jgi:hypothetical protein
VRNSPVEAGYSTGMPCPRTRSRPGRASSSSSPRGHRRTAPPPRRAGWCRRSCRA